MPNQCQVVAIDHPTGPDYDSSLHPEQTKAVVLNTESWFFLKLINRMTGARNCNSYHSGDREAAETPIIARNSLLLSRMRTDARPLVSWGECRYAGSSEEFQQSEERTCTGE